MGTNIIIYVSMYKFMGAIGTLIGLAWYTSHRFTKIETKIDLSETRLGRIEDKLSKEILK